MAPCKKPARSPRLIGRSMLSAPARSAAAAPREEDAAAPEHGGHGDEEARPAEQRRELGLHTAPHPAVEREGDRHDVARRRARQTDPREHRAILAAAQGLPLRAATGMGRVAERVQAARHRRERHPLGIEADERLGAWQIEPDLDHAGNEARQPLHEPDARATVNTLEIQLGGEHAVGRRATGARAKPGVVELGVGAPARPRRARGFARGGPQRVVALEPVFVEDRVHALGSPRSRTGAPRRARSARSAPGARSERTLCRPPPRRWRARRRTDQ